MLKVCLSESVATFWEIMDGRGLDRRAERANLFPLISRMIGDIDSGFWIGMNYETVEHVREASKMRTCSSGLLRALSPIVQLPISTQSESLLDMLGVNP